MKATYKLQSSKSTYGFSVLRHHLHRVCWLQKNYLIYTKTEINKEKLLSIWIKEFEFTLMIRSASLDAAFESCFINVTRKMYPFHDYLYCCQLIITNRNVYMTVLIATIA